MSGSGNIPMTPSGLRKLKAELKHLQTVERGKISREIEVARAHGDLRENAEYHAAKEKQSHIEGRILDLNDWIARAEVIDTARNGESCFPALDCRTRLSHPSRGPLFPGVPDSI